MRKRVGKLLGTGLTHEEVPAVDIISAWFQTKVNAGGDVI